MSPKITILLCIGAFFVKNAYCQHGNPGYIKTGAYGSPGIPCGPSANLAPNSPPYMAAQLAIPTGETLAIPTGVNLAIPITECAGYSGTGVGDVVVTGEMPVEGITLVTGQVPIIGSVRFAGDVSASGIVSALGTCGCGCGLGNAFVS